MTKGKEIRNKYMAVEQLNNLARLHDDRALVAMITRKRIKGQVIIRDKYKYTYQVVCQGSDWNGCQSDNLKVLCHLMAVDGVDWVKCWQPGTHG